MRPADKGEQCENTGAGLEDLSHSADLSCSVDSDSHWFQLNVSGGARALENPGVNNAQDVDVRKAKIVIPTFAYFSEGSLDRETMRQVTCAEHGVSALPFCVNPMPIH
ncbi:hypothetical protein M404DRAFT_1003168 [Pisolithus tinctorius Marx 270]|uniref:Uncharacterized protein n=1 Tax=Pisolithus tinctorius Marx 270 TaxID=870435 RepID=A0A0C3JVK2_PISTI|nr:hypothetical protein M404DRAFT_1003168 [Pisolithus tinctorius Marx 270]